MISSKGKGFYIYIYHSCDLQVDMSIGCKVNYKIMKTYSYKEFVMSGYILSFQKTFLFYLFKVELTATHNVVPMDVNVIISIWSGLFMPKPQCMQKFMDDDGFLYTSITKG